MLLSGRRFKVQKLLFRRSLGTTNVPHSTPTAAATEVASLIERSRKAHQQIEHYTQEQVDDLLRALVRNKIKIFY